MQRLQALQNGQFGSKIKYGKNMRKNMLQEHYGCLVQKNPLKKTKYLRNEEILKIGHLAKPIAHARFIAFAKMVSLCQK